MPRARGPVPSRPPTSRRVTRTYDGPRPAHQVNRDARPAVRVCVPGRNLRSGRGRTADGPRTKETALGTRKRGVHEHGSAAHPRTAPPLRPAPHRRHGPSRHRGGRYGPAPVHTHGPPPGRRPRRRAVGLHPARRTPPASCRGTRGPRPGEPATAARVRPLPRRAAERGGRCRPCRRQWADAGRRVACRRRTPGTGRAARGAPRRRVRPRGDSRAYVRGNGRGERLADRSWGRHPACRTVGAGGGDRAASRRRAAPAGDPRAGGSGRVGGGDDPAAPARTTRSR